MNWPARIALILAAAIPIGAALAQGVLQQAGPGTQGHAPAYANPAQTGSQPVVIDSGPASGGGPGVGLSELNVTARGTGTAPFAGQGSGPSGTVFCLQDAPSNNTGGYHFLCFSANAGSNNGLVTFGAAGVATPGTLNFNINGTPVAPVTCPTGSPTSSFATINGIVTHC